MNKVKCNWCEQIFDEETIDEYNYYKDNEYCPNCNKFGYLMDLQ